MSTHQIEEALLRLDPNDDSHWTTEGKPRVDAVVSILSASDPLFDTQVKRADLDEALPGFDRGQAVSADDEADAEPEVTVDAEAEQTDPQAGPVDEPAASPVVDEKAEARAKFIVELDWLAARRSILDTERDTLTQAIRALDTEAARLTEEMNSTVGPIPFAVAHKMHVEAQMADRMRRAGRVKAVNEFAGGPTGLTAKAPIDAAMARRSGFGGGRPQAMLKGG